MTAAVGWTGFVALIFCYLSLKKTFRKLCNDVKAEAEGLRNRRPKTKRPRIMTYTE
jgi:hypothetical protein